MNIGQKDNFLAKIAKHNSPCLYTYHTPSNPVRQRVLIKCNTTVTLRQNCYNTAF